MAEEENNKPYKVRQHFFFLRKMYVKVTTESANINIYIRNDDVHSKMKMERK